MGIEKVCACCGNRTGCDCERTLKNLENVNHVAHIWKKSTERARALLDTMGECSECHHAWSLHADEHGCEHEPGDRDGVALAPCQCKATPHLELVGLSSKIDQQQRAMRKLIHEHTERQQERDALRAALEPFAAIWNKMKAVPGCLGLDYEEVAGVPWPHIRVAAETLQKQKAPAEEPGRKG